MIGVDGDVIVYKVAWACKDEDISVATSTLDSLLTSWLCNAATDCEDYTVYLSGPSAENYRHKVTDDYKANRSEAERPEHYYGLREHMMEQWNAVMSSGEEADDVLVQCQYLDPDNYTIVSIDKDFLQSHGWHFNPDKKLRQYVTETEGLHFLYTQCLVGDQVDNIKGAKGIGPVKAARALEWCGSEEELYSVCLGLFNGDEEALTKTMRLVYLRRVPNEWWVSPQRRNDEQSATGNPTGSSPPVGDYECSDGSSWLSTIPSGKGGD